jgi:organic radical activating enzyme
MNKETFCSLPFIEIFLGPDGGIKTCCSSVRTLGFLNENSIQEILKSDNAKSIRQSIIEGKWHPACSQCERLENQGARSERKNDLESFIDKVPPVDKSFFELQRLDLRWSNICNLSCIYCYEYFSSKWANIKGITINTLKDENEQDFLLYIEKNKSTLENILFLGGEPLLQKQNKILLDIVSNKSVYILTNLAVPLKNNPIINKLISSRYVSYGVSFETIKDRYEYVRHGAEWNVFDSNLDYLQSKIKNFSITAHSMYSIYSAFNLVEFYEYILSKNVFNNIHWSLLESSSENINASIFKLSRPLKNIAISEIDKVLDIFPNAYGTDDLINIKEVLVDTSKDLDPKDNDFILEINSLESQLNKVPEKKFKDLWPNIFEILLENSKK